MVIILKTKYICLLILLIIVFLIVGFVRNHNFKTNTLNPIDDIREYDQMHESLTDDEIPELVLNNSKNLISEFKENVEKRNVEEFDITKIQTVLGDDGNYRTAYLIIDTLTNTKVAKILLFYNRDGLVVRIKLEFNNQGENIILIYNESLLSLSVLNISETDKQKIQDGLKNNFEKGWSVENIYTYENISTSSLRIINLYNL